MKKASRCTVRSFFENVGRSEQIRTVTEAEMLDALYEEALAFAARVERGEAQLSHGRVNIVPPDPLPRRDGTVPLIVVQSKP